MLVGLLLGGCSSSESLPTVKVIDSGKFVGRGEQKITPYTDYKYTLVTSKATYYGLHNLPIDFMSDVRVEIKSDDTKFLCGKSQCAKIKYVTVNKS